jgi:imidazole glycerol phosphate synthase glutamine amidotransferase subunit
MIGLVDYGASNLLSVKKALAYLDADCRIIQRKEDFNGVKRLILPGVGAFQTAIENLRSSGLYEIIRDWLNDNRPFLGICLGMQVLFEKSEESEKVEGFGIFRGNVLHFTKHKVPQIGWNQVHLKRKSDMMEGIENNSFFYFLHGYYVQTPNCEIVVGTTEYGVEYVSAAEKNNIWAVQFHPEKSGKAGLQLIQNWIMPC